MAENARSKNAFNEIIGILLYCDGIFIQLLEGEEGKVRETFERISKDPRHTAIHNIVSAKSEKRYFPDCLISYKSISPADLVLIEQHDNLDIKSSQPYKLIRLLSLSSY